MAYSYVRYSGNGSTTNYTFSFPTISQDHITVRVNGSLVTNWSFLSASTIQFAVAPANAAVIEIRRETPKDSPIVDFADGSVLLERDLDLLATWQLYVAQETEDDLEDTIRVDSQGRFDALNKRIINVADPVNAQDAVTKNWAETAMSSQLNQATAQATAAAGSATAAAGSANAAATSAGNASTSASNAASSATGASNSATAAAGSATAAANSATAAGTSATNANSSAVAAASSATASASSATTATTQAINAAASAVNAANSAAAAAAALDNFDDRYLGQKASDPSVDNDGAALITGALYYNTTDSAMRVYTGTGWINASSAQVATMKTYVYVATAAQTTFTGNDANGSSLTYVAPYLTVSLNGLELRPVVDYTATSGLSVILTSAAAAGDELQVQAFSAFNVANIQSANVGYKQGGTSSIVRSVEQKLKEMVSVLDFGADPTGITDSTAAIQSAILEAGAVYFPDGIYKVTSINLTGKDTTALIGNGRATLRSTLTTGSIVYCDNTGGITPSYRVGIDGVNVECATYQVNVTAVSLVGDGSGTYGSGGAPYSFFRNFRMNNTGRGFNFSRNWLISCDRVHVYYCGTPLRIRDVQNSIEFTGCVLSGLSDAQVTAGATRQVLIDMEYVRGLHFSGGSIEGICSKTLSMYRCDGVVIEGNFVEVNPNDTNRFEDCAGIAIRNNFWRIGKASASTVNVGDSSVLPVFYVLKSTAGGAGVYGTSKGVADISFNQFQIDFKPSTGTVTLFDSTSAGNTGLVKAESNLISMAGLSPTPINSPVLFNDYLPDSGVASGQFKTMVVTKTTILQPVNNFRYSSDPSRSSRALVSGCDVRNNLRVMSAVMFRQISGSASPSGTYYLKRDRAGTISTLATATGPLVDNGTLTFTGSTLATLEVLAGDRLFVSGPGGGSLDSFWEVEITIVEYDPQSSS